MKIRLWTVCLVAALGLIACRAGAQDMVWRPAPQAPADTPLVKLYAPQPLETPTPQSVPVNPAPISDQMVVRAQAPAPLIGGPGVPPPPAYPGYLVPGSPAENFACGQVAQGDSGPGILAPIKQAIIAPGSEPCQTARIWGSADYMLFWVRSGPVPTPLVTTNATPGTIGALNEPGTRILFGGGGDLNYGPLSGVRLTLGGWIDSGAIFGAEVSGFGFGSGAEHFSASSAGGTAPVVSIPFTATVPFGINPAGPTSLNAGGAPNNVSARSASGLWEAEANGLWKVLGNSTYNVVLLAGFRYLQVKEDLGLNDTFADAATGGYVSVTDTFETRNEFYGGQVGAKGSMNFGPLSLEATVKLGLGATFESSNISGNSVVSKGAFGFPSGTVGEGLFAEPSNIGHHSRTEFGVLPEFQFQLGYDVTPHLRLALGYDFLYINDILRPGPQVDPIINPTQNTLFGGTGGVLKGTPAPVTTFRSSDFWAQGLYFKVEIRF
jgi:hypothetical protein